LYGEKNITLLFVFLRLWDKREKETSKEWLRVFTPMTKED
jgi:hypothetical protein